MNDDLNGQEYYRRRAMKRLAAAAVIIVIAGGLAFYFVHSDSFQRISSLETSAEHLAAQELSKTFSAPPPIIATGTTAATGGGGGTSGGAAVRGNGSINSNTLTREGVITDTNIERSTNGNLPALAENATLDDIASLRLDDMFAKQYFAHVSPSSSSAETVAATVGYDYIALGENLALGNFGGDQGVVTAWMNSPGHRANILNTHYTQIGVAVKEGLFEGSKTWIAVQIFGRPLSDCPPPETSLKSQIVSDQDNVTQMQANLQAMKSQLDAMRPQYGDAYNQAAANYNALVDQYNNLIAQIKAEIARYNVEVESYNTCISS